MGLCVWSCIENICFTFFYRWEKRLVRIDNLDDVLHTTLWNVVFIVYSCGYSGFHNLENSIKINLYRQEFLWNLTIFAWTPTIIMYWAEIILLRIDSAFRTSNKVIILYCTRFTAWKCNAWEKYAGNQGTQIGKMDLCLKLSIGCEMLKHSRKMEMRKT